MAELLTAGQPYSVVRGHVEAFVKRPEITEPPLTETQLRWIKEVLAESTRLSELRHRIVHGLWLYTTAELEWVSLRPGRHELLPGRQALTAEQIYMVARDIALLTPILTG
jgi:hypothetical protein